MRVPQLPLLDRTTILGAGVLVYALLGYALRHWPLTDALSWAGLGGTWMGLPERRAVPVVQTRHGEAVPVAPEG